MISLNPREQFMILRKLGDHTDSTTYYVRAVIRNSVTGQIIETLNLIDSGSNSRRFYKLYEIPSDISGQGFYIDIETSVYTDSGYTTKASSYTDDLEQYLVFDRIIKTGGGGGGGVDVDYKKIEKILAEMIKPLTGLKNTELGPVLAQIKGVLEEVKNIKIDNTPVLEEIRRSEKDIVKSIVEKPVTPATKLEELETKILESINKKEPKLDGVYSGITNLKNMLKDYFEDSILREKKFNILVEKFNNVRDLFKPIDGLDVPNEKIIKRDSRVSKLLGKNI